ncbi:hypothetical protein FACS1894151_07880 [Spirochaetia bacterium]|nr:hypothetical protein FACS1894151_07880 [Spirochaetia bacterium]
MKRFLGIICAVFVLFVIGCTTSTVTRRGTDEVIDLNERWNETDERQSCEALIQSALSSPSVAQFIEDYKASHRGALPAARVGEFTNITSDHNIDGSRIAKAMEIAIVNSGKLDFVAGGGTLEQLRAERDEQQNTGYASDATVVDSASEIGAILLFTGQIDSIRNQRDNRTVITYKVSAELTNVETARRIWMDEHQITKDYQRANVRP